MSRIRVQIRKFISTVLAICVLCTTDFNGLTYVNAASIPTGTVCIQTSEGPVSLQAVTNGGDPQVAIEYGQKFSLIVSGVDGETEFYYEKAPFDPDWSVPTRFDNNTTLLTPGTHYFVAYTNSGEEQHGAEGEYAIQVDKLALATPVNLRWNGRTAEWDNVNYSINGTAIPAVTPYYTVQLYKDGVACGASIPEDHYNSYDFSSVISDVSYGDYTFKVTAVAPTGQEALYEASEESAESAAYVYRDNTAPTVTFSISGGDFYATAVDSETAVTAYAFSTKASAESVTEWKTVESNTPGAEVILSEAATAAGTYYFYARNAHNLVKKSDNSINATGIVFHDYYNGGSDLIAKTEYIIGNGDLSFDLSKVSAGRTGHTFDGWYLEDTFVNAAGSSLAIAAANTGTLVDVYAKWSGQSVDIKTQPAPITFTYDGTDNHTVSAALEDAVTGDISWKWYKKTDDSAIEVSDALHTETNGGKTSTLKLKNTEDAGTYYAIATVSAAGLSDQYATTDDVTVTINKRKVYVKGKSLSITYGDDAPAEYSYVLTDAGNGASDCGLVAGDDIDALLGGFTGNLSTDYVKWANAGTYAITVSDNAVCDNYEVIFHDTEKGYLTVNAKAVSDADSKNVAIKLFDGKGSENYTYDYMGSDIRPQVKVYDTSDGTEREISVPSTDIVYADNVSANDNATVTVTFSSGNYSGSLTKKFAIKRVSNSAILEINNWTYGNPADTPSLRQSGTGRVTYYYQSKNLGSFEIAKATTEVPVDAGDYWLAAKIDACTNYDEMVTEPISFTILKKKIVVTSYGGTWDYDGNAHGTAHVPAVEITEGGFVGEDSYNSLSATTTITNVGTEINRISLTLSSATKASNYDISFNEGVLTVNQATLPIPAGLKWSDTSIGRLNWTAVNRANTTVKYTVNLYRIDIDDSTNTLIHTYETTDTYLNLLDVMLEDTSANEKYGYGYAATIQVSPVYGAGDIQNYKLSNPSNIDDMAARYTATFAISRSTGVDSATIDGGSSRVMFQGERAALSLTEAWGYNTGITTYRAWDIVGKSSSFAYVTDSHASDTYLHYGTAGTAKSSALVTVNAAAKDSSPEIQNFKAENNDASGNENVKISFNAYDRLGLDSYAISVSNNSATVTEWKPISQESKAESGHTSYYKKLTLYIDEPNSYYVFVKDNQGNITVIDTPVTVYKLTFDGSGNDNAASMAPVVKLQNSTITLPENLFTKTGYSLRYWAGSTGMYMNRGAYAANSSDNLVAQWTNDSFSYDVEYYYMGLDGNYPAVYDAKETFKTGYGNVVAVSDNDIQKSRPGFKLDISQNAPGTASYTVTSAGTVTLKVYYERKQHTITYRYTDTSGSDVPDIVYTYRYGQPVEDRSTPAAPGYKFVGWNYGSDSQAPATMPDNDLVFTGAFEANETKYHVVYYGQKLDPAGFGSPNWAKIYDEYFRIEELTYNTVHDAALDYSIGYENDETGFTNYAVVVTYGHEAGETMPGTGVHYVSSEAGLDLNLTADRVTAGNEVEQTYINVYCLRNVNTVTLSVYKDDRETGTLLYTNSAFDISSQYDYLETGTDASGNEYIKLPFGTPFNETLCEKIENFGYDATEEQNDWLTAWRSGQNDLVPGEIKGYKLADFKDWSTGERPLSMGMPDGPVKVTREYVLASSCEYTVNVYIQNAVTQKDSQGRDIKVAKYPDAPSYSFNYIAAKGSTVTLGNGGTYTVDYTKFDSKYSTGVIDNFDYYEYDTAKNGGADHMEGEVTDPKEATLEFNVYFKRVVTNAHITYYYNDETGSENTKLGQIDVSGAWGTSYKFDPDLCYDGVYSGLTSVAGSPSAIDFRHNNYLVSYRSYWLGVNSSSSSPSNAITTYADLSADYYCTFSAPRDSKESNVYVYYTKLCPTDTFFVNIKARHGGVDEPISVSLNDRTVTDKEVITSFTNHTNYVRRTTDESPNLSVSVSCSDALKDKNYELRVANKADIFEATAGSASTTDTDYPAAKIREQMLAGTYWSYTGAIKSDYEPVTFTLKDLKTGTVVAEETYYVGKNPDGAGKYYIYVIDGDRNQFFAGNRISYNFHNEDYYTKFFLNFQENVYEYAITGNYGIYYNGVSETPVRNNAGDPPKPSNVTQIVTFYSDPVYYSIGFNYNGKTKYAKSELSGTSVNLADKFATPLFAPENGYHIVWYTDVNFENKAVTTGTKTIEGNWMYYGRSERDGILCKEYAFYADFDGNYVNKAYLDSHSFTETVSSNLGTVKYEKITESESKEFIIEPARDGKAAITIIKDAETIYYYENGRLICVVADDYYPSNSDITMDTSVYETVNGVEGFEFDESNDLNKLKGAVTTATISLMAYYQRKTVRLYYMFDPSNENETLWFRQLKYNEHTSLTEPEKNGYHFAGWKYYKNDGKIEISSNDVGEEKVTKKVNLVMPEYSVLAEGQWTPWNFDYDIPYYYQKNDGTYDRTTMSAIRNMDASERSDRQIGVTLKSTESDRTLSGYLVYTDAGHSSILGAYFVSGNESYYFANSDMKLEGGIVNVNIHDLVSATQTVSVTSEDELTVSDYVMDMSNYKIFQYSFASYHHKSTIETYTAGQEGAKFEAFPDMSLAYYYIRTNNTQIRAGLKSADGGETGAVISDAAKYSYGDEAVMTVVLHSGYEIEGWYKASDVLEGYPTDGSIPTSLSSFALKSDYSSYTKVAGSALSYKVKVVDDMDYICVTRPTGVVSPTAKITSERNLTTNPYVYNYEDSAHNTLSVGLAWPAGEDHTSMTVTGYKWYVKYYEVGADISGNDELKAMDLSEFTEITDGTSPTNLIAKGKNAGTYVYRCLVNVQNLDNGRERTVWDTFRLDIGQFKDYDKASSYSLDYTGAPHYNSAYVRSEYVSELSGKHTFKYAKDTDIENYYSSTYRVNHPEADVSLNDYIKDNVARLRMVVEGAYNAGVSFSEETPHVRDVRDSEANPYYFYYYVESTNPNYGNTAGRFYIKLNPVYLTISPKNHFTKVYDGTTDVSGNPMAADWEDSVRYRLAKNTGDYYQIDGIVAGDADAKLLLDYESAHFNNAHVLGASALDMTGLKIITEVDGAALDARFAENYNYVFASGYKNLQLSAEITPYVLDVKWDDTDLNFIYDGKLHAPAIIVEDVSSPEKLTAAAILVHGQQKNNGTYTATATIGDGVGYTSSDYTVSIAGTQFTIVPRYLRVYPQDKSVYYNGEVRTINEYRFESSEDNVAFTSYTLPTGESIVATSVGNGKDAGSYTISVKDGSVKVYSGGTNITDNYIISLGTGTLTINECPVIVEGIGANNKVYDGNANATPDISGLSFKRIVPDPSNAGRFITESGLYGSDSLSFTADNVTAVFENEKAGSGKNVSLSYNEPTDGDWKNYRLIGATPEAFSASDSFGSEASTTADITQDGVYLQLEAVSSYYGEMPVYTWYFSSDVSGQNRVATETVGATGTPDIKISKWILTDASNNTYTLTDVLATGGNSASVKTVDAGIYCIFPVTTAGIVNGITSENYKIYYAYNGPATKTGEATVANEAAALTISKRMVKVQPGSGAKLTKDFDNTVNAASIEGLYEFIPVSGDTHSGLVNSDTLTLSQHSKKYNSKNVTEADKVSVTGCEISSNNYILYNDSFDIDGQINPISATYTVKDADISYGDAAPATYSYTYTSDKSGIASVKTYLDSLISKLSTGNAYVCDYEQDAASVSSNVGSYVVTVSDANPVTDSNVTITYAPGALNVKKRAITVTPLSKTITYGWTSNMQTEVFDDISWNYAGFVYGQNENTAEGISGKEGVSAKAYDSTDTAITTTSPAGDYTIKLANVERITAKNYHFVPAANVLTIDKYYLSVTGIKVKPREFDGTIKVYDEQYDYDNVRFTYYENGNPHDVSQNAMLANGTKVLDNINVTGTFDNPYSGEHKTAYLSITLKPYLADRYELITEENKDTIDHGSLSGVEPTQKRAVGDVVVTKRPIELRPTDVTIKYGERVSVVSVSSNGSGKKSWIETYNGTSLKPIASIEHKGTYVEGTDNLDAIGFVLNYTIRSNVYNPATEYTADDVSGYGDTGTYTISISDSDPRYSHANSYLKDTAAGFDEMKDFDPDTNFSQNYLVRAWGTGTLTVEKNKLATPVNKWSTTEPGKYTFNEVPGIGAVAVDKYEFALFKNGVKVAGPYNTTDNASMITKSGSVYTVDLTEIIRSNGAGKYTVKVQAVASTVNNALCKNVDDSVVSAGTDALYATEITLKYADDAVTKAAYVSGGSPAPGSYVQIKDVSAGDSVRRVFLSGENLDTDIYAQWQNADGYVTGYEIDDISTNNPALIGITTGKTGLSVSDTAKNGKVYGTIKLLKSVTATDAATGAEIVISLKKRPAKVSASINVVNSEATYMYTAEGAPIATITPIAEVTDSVDATGYSYTYTWKYRKGMGSFNDVSAEDLNSSKDEWKVPTGFTGGSYSVYVKVEATRKDNGETFTIGNVAPPVNWVKGEFKIKKASPKSEWVTVSMNDFTYGESRIQPEAQPGTGCPGISGLGTQTVYYKQKGAADSTYTTTVPTEAGDYTVRIHFAENENFASFDSTAKDYRIKQAQLAKPGNLNMTASSTAPYGLIVWDAVTGPKENAGVSSHVPGDISVKYEVKLFYTDNGEVASPVYAPIASAITTDVSHNFTEEINANEAKPTAKPTGRYEITVRALVANDEDGNGSVDAWAKNDCADSEESVLFTKLHIATTISSDKASNTMEYDGRPMTLTVAYEVPGATYQWTRNGVDISGATGKTLKLYHVEDTAVYCCKIIEGPTTKYTTTLSAKILPRTITIHTGSAAKNYDGTALTKNLWWIDENGDDSISANSAGSVTDLGAYTEGGTYNVITGVAVNGTITNVNTAASANNTADLSGVVITDANGKVVYNASMKAAGTANYQLKLTKGTLMVNKRSLSNGSADTYTSGISVGSIADRTYDGTFHKPTVTVTDNVTGASVTLAEGTDYTLTWENNIHATTASSKAYVVITGKGNYSGEIRKEFNINRRNITITSDNAEKVYDGTALTKHSISYNDLAATDTITVGTWTGSITDVSVNAGGTEVPVENIYSNVTIRHSNASVGDVTSDYNITENYGTLKLLKRPVTIKSSTRSWQYDGKIHTYYNAADALSQLSVTAGSLASGEKIATVSFDMAAKVKDVADGDVSNNYSGVTITKAGAVDTTDNYNITFDAGYLRVTPRPIASGTTLTSGITVTPPADKVYTGDFITPTDEVIKDNVSGSYYTLVRGADYDISGYEWNKEVEQGTEIPKVVIVGKGNYSGTYKIKFTILKADQTISANDLTVTYDGVSHSITGATAKGTVSDGDLGASGISYSSNNSRTDAGTTTVTITAAARRNYKSATATRLLTVNKHSLDHITIPVNEFIYDGTAMGPGHVYTVTADLPTGTVTLTEGVDYTITVDESVNKRVKAVEVDTYYIEAVGKGNYEGTIYVTYSIKDDRDPQITNATEGGIYCKGKTVTVEDPNLVSVTVTQRVKDSAGNYGASTTFANITGITASTEDIHLPGSEYGTEYTIVAKDKSDNTLTMKVYVYDDHKFTAYTYDDSTKLSKTAPCDHLCGATDTHIERWGSVAWNYAYSYTVGDGSTHSGTQGKDVRNTHAVVMLLQNEKVIASTVVSCNDPCALYEESVTGNDTFKFDTYIPEGSATPVPIPEKDEDGIAYTYIIEVHPSDAFGEKVNDYFVTYSEDYSIADYGYRAHIDYEPGCFEVPWKVTVRGVDAGISTTIHPEALYVKVLFALGPDDPDEGYNIISQQDKHEDLGVLCMAHANGDGSYSYTGSYPVWKYQGGTKKSYYHRIQLSGYSVNGHYFNIEAENLRSICDDDHINHTVYYVPGADAEDNGRSSGTILYNLDFASMPGAVLIFDANEGTDTTNKATLANHVITKAENAPVSAEEIAAEVPVRGSYYVFKGWYDSRKGGSQVTDIAALSGVQKVYAHWKELVKPGATINIGSNSYSSYVEPADVTYNDTYSRSTKPVVEAVDTDRGTGVECSGVSENYYYISDTPIRSDEITDTTIVWTLFDKIIDVPSDGEYIIYVKVVDKDGNVEYVSTDGIRWTAPIVIPSDDPAPAKPAEEPIPGPVAPTGKPGARPKPSAPVITPVEPTGPDTDPTVGPDEGDEGTLVVYVEHPGIDEGAPNDTHIEGVLPDAGKVAEAVLTEEEREMLKNGSDIEIRLTVENDDTEPTDKAVGELISQLEEEINKDSEEELVVRYVTKIDLTLEKKVDTKDWEQILQSGDDITVVVNIPAMYVHEGEKLYLAKKDGSGYVILEDLDDNPDTITIATNDFDTEYILLSIMDEDTARALGLLGDDLSEPANPDDLFAGDGKCFWHWLILLADILMLLGILLTLKRKEIEEDENPERYEENLEDYEDRRKKSARERALSEVALALIMVVINILGSCHIELPASIVSVLVTSVLQYMAYRHKFKDKEDEANEN